MSASAAGTSWVAEQGHGGGQQHAADNGAVDEHGSGHADAEHLEGDDRQGGENGEHGHHDHRGAGDHAGAAGDAAGDGAGGGGAAVPQSADAAEEEYLGVHGAIPASGGPRRSTERWPGGMRLVPVNDHVPLAGGPEHGIHGDHEWGRSGADEMVSGGSWRVWRWLPFNQESLGDRGFRELSPPATLLWSWVSGVRIPSLTPSKAALTSGFIPRVREAGPPGRLGVGQTLLSASGGRPAGLR